MQFFDYEKTHGKLGSLRSILVGQAWMMIKFLVSDIWWQHPKNVDVVCILIRGGGMGHSAIEINFGSERK